MDKIKAISGKQVSLNMIANVISYSSNLIISFLLTPFLVNSLGKEIYSFYPIANTIVLYISVLTNSMNTIASRFVTISMVRNDKEQANYYFSSVMASNIIISMIMSVIMLIIILFIDKFLNVPVNSVAAVKGLFFFIFASALINVLSSVYGIATFATNRIDLRSLRELITAILKILLFVIFYTVFKPSIVFVGIVSLIVAVVNLAFQRYYTKMLLPTIQLTRSYVSKSHVSELFRASMWNMIFTFGNVMLVGMSFILANIYYGSSASGDLSIVQTVPQFINGVISMLVGVFFPVITYKVTDDDSNAIIQELLKDEKIIGILSSSVIIVFIALASDFFSLWMPSENSYQLSVLSFISIFPHIIISCMWILTNVNIAMNKVKIPAVFTMGLGLTNIILVSAIARYWNFGIIAIPIISTILQIIWTGVFLPIYSCKQLGTNNLIFYPTLIKIIAAIFPLLLFIIFIKQYFSLDSWINFIVFSVVMSIFTFCFIAVIIVGPNYFFGSLKRVIKIMISKDK